MGFLTLGSAMRRLSTDTPLDRLGKLARRLMNTPVLPLMAYAPVYGQAMRGTVRPAFIVGAVIATGLFAFGDYIEEAYTEATDDDK